MTWIQEGHGDCTPVILATWEIEAGERLSSGVQDKPGQQSQTQSLKQKQNKKTK